MGAATITHFILCDDWKYRFQLRERDQFQVTQSPTPSELLIIRATIPDRRDTNWLSAPSGSTTTPSQLTFSVPDRCPGVNPGASATVTLHPTAPSGVADVIITVTFSGSGGGGGGGSNTLTPSQTSVTLPGNGNVVLSTTSTSAISLTAGVSQSSCGNVNWLAFQLPITTVSSAASTTLTVVVNSSGLTSGQVCQGTITVTPSTGTALQIPVTFTVGGAAAVVGR